MPLNRGVRVASIFTIVLTLAGCSEGMSFEEYAKRSEYCERLGLKPVKKGFYRSDKTVTEVLCVDKDGSEFNSKLLDK